MRVTIVVDDSGTAAQQSHISAVTKSDRQLTRVMAAETEVRVPGASSSAQPIHISATTETVQSRARQAQTTYSEELKTR